MKKIAIVNRTNLKNFGSVLQCYALCETIAEMGYDTEILWEQGNVSKNFDFRPIKIIKTLMKIITHPSLLRSTIKNIGEIQSKEVNEETIRLFEEFVNKHIRQKLLSHKELIKVAKSEEYFKLICGSDQVWCSTTTYVDPLMYLRFAPAEKRIAYAPSIGRDYIPKYNRRQMRKNIREIPFVSIRETEGQRLIKELTGRDVPVVLDPTLLISVEHWNTIKADVLVESPYLLCYFLDAPSCKMQNNIAKFAKDNDLYVISLGTELSWLSNELKVLHPDCGPAEFLGYVQSAELVLTDSYHGMLFSIIYEKKFWAVERIYKQFDQSSRQLTVLQMFNLESRYLPFASEFSGEEIDYKLVKKVLDQKKILSKKYLLDAIES